jgi:MoaA/NifB/PqqE/SkfB family radical SAM enzyme
MIIPLLRRFLTEPDMRTLRRFALSAGWRTRTALKRIRRHRPGDPLLPPFLFISVTNDCNLCCQGCWVTPSTPPAVMAPEVLDRVITRWERRGAFFFGLLGGEPLMVPGLMDIAARHPKSCFQVFTNGLLLDDAVAARMSELGNVTPLISVEGVGEAGDHRRGGRDVTTRALEALDICRRHRLIAGVATSVCRTNIDDLATESFLREMISRGALYAWYYIYRPVGPNPSPEIALSADDILRLRRFLVDVRSRVPILVVDAYWDERGRALCPAAAGLSHHINPSGHVEPCPVIQFAGDSVGDGTRADAIVESSVFLAGMRKTMADAGPGCILMRNPNALADYLTASGAEDTTGRNGGWRELEAMTPRPDHEMGDAAIPERHWFYRMAKRNVFWGLGAYG